MATQSRVKSWSVYAHTNTINGKKYIGITSQKPELRWENGHGYDYNPYLYNEIVNYGWDSFSHEILFSDLSEPEAKAMEIELIERYNTTNELYGYNLTRGGEGSLGRKVSNETSQKISNSHIGLKHSSETKAKISNALYGNPRALGYHHTDATRKRLSEMLMGNQYAKGYHHTDETRAKMSASHIGKKLSAETIEKLRQINTGRVMSEESRAKISKANTGHQRRLGMRHSEESKRKMSQSKKKLFSEHPEMAQRMSDINKKPVDMLNKDSEYIRTFSSAKDAMTELGIDNSSIIKVCKNKMKSAGGYLWRYHIDII